MIMIGYLAEKYHMLPSEIVARATTFDIMVNDLFTTWQESKTNPTDISNYRMEDLEKLVKAVQ